MPIVHRPVLAASVVVVTLLAGCGGGGGGRSDGPVAPSTPAAVASVTISAPAQSVTAGNTLQLSATTRDASGNVLTGRAVTWTSNSGSVATVGASTGLLTAVGGGAVTVTATSEGVVSTPFPLTIIPIEGGAAASLYPPATIGKVTFPDRDTPSGGQGEPVGGVGCIVTIAAHFHAHVSLFVNGEQIAMGRGIGLPQGTLANGQITGGACRYWLHTHDASGVVHVEPPSTSTVLTVGQLFAVWGQPLTTSNVAGFQGPVAVYVNGSPYTGDMAAIPFDVRKEITLTVGTPPAYLPRYSWPDGY